MQRTNDLDLGCRQWIDYGNEGNINDNPEFDSLDLFSTSPTKEDFAISVPSEKCSYNAPYFAYCKLQKTWVVTQGNCHHWDCPRCGIGRARQEYGRIIEGCRLLASEGKLWFITITCRGKELSVEDAEKGYLGWTNRFLDACRAQSKRKGGKWVYVQVTERQKRAHPHSHILTSYHPPDLYLGHVWKFNFQAVGGGQSERQIALRSDWLQGQVVKSGLGEQYDISSVNSAEGASRYVAKYMFKDSMFDTHWPKGWKRVRYSQSFPKLPERETDAICLLSREDWQELARRAVVVDCSDLDTFEYVQFALHGSDTIVDFHPKKKVENKKNGR